MLFKFLFSLNYVIQETATKVDASTYEASMRELNKVSTILSIGLITILSLLTLSLFKINKLQRENNRLKQALNK